MFPGKLTAAIAFLLEWSPALFAVEGVPKYSAEKKTEFVEVRIAIAGEPETTDCPLTVTIHNIGSETLSIKDAFNGLYHSRFTIESSNGKPCPYTKRGSSAFPNPLYESGSMRDNRIAPGSEFTFIIYLEDFFQLTAGNWLLKFQASILGQTVNRSVELPEMKFAIIERPQVSTQIDDASVDHPFINSLGMKFVPVEITWGPTRGQKVLFCVWPTRVQDFDAFAKAVNLKSGPWRSPGFPQRPKHPVVNVTWNDVKAFCLWLTAKEHQDHVLPASKGYRLPMDLEWSKAVGLPEEAGKTPSDRDGKIADVFPWGAEWPPAPGAGNYNGEETGSDLAIKGYNDGFTWTAPVGSFKPNKFGLYDMGGNVLQWCMDYWDPKSYAKALRGASWCEGNVKSNLFSSRRFHAVRDTSTDQIGFRLVLSNDATPIPPTPSAQPR